MGTGTTNESLSRLSHLGPVQPRSPREALTKTDEELLWIDSAKNRVLMTKTRPILQLLGLSPSASQAEIQDAHRLRDARLERPARGTPTVCRSRRSLAGTQHETLRREYDKSNRESTKPQLAEPETQTERQILTEAPNLRFIGSSRMSINVGQKIVCRSRRSNDADPASSTPRPDATSPGSTHDRNDSILTSSAKASRLKSTRNNSRAKAP